MINEDVWVHILEMRAKAYYLATKLNNDETQKLVEAIDEIYYAYYENFQ